MCAVGSRGWLGDRARFLFRGAEFFCCTCVGVVRVWVCPGMGVRMWVSACVLVVQKIGAHVHQTDHVFRKLVSTAKLTRRRLLA